MRRWYVDGDAEHDVFLKRPTDYVICLWRARRGVVGIMAVWIIIAD